MLHGKPGEVRVIVRQLGVAVPVRLAVAPLRLALVGLDHCTNRISSTISVGTSPNAQASAPPVDWSADGETPHPAGGFAKAVVISEEDIITATPKKAWNGIAANSSRIRIT